MIADYRRWHPDYSPADVFFAATTDSRSWRGQVIEAERRAAQPAPPIAPWVYQFDWPTPIDGGKWGAHHGLDVPFVFDNARIVPEKVGTGQDAQPLVGAHERDRVWRSRGAAIPNVEGLPRWPTYDLSRRATMVFDRRRASSTIRAAASAGCLRRFLMFSPVRSVALAAACCRRSLVGAFGRARARHARRAQQHPRPP